MKNRFLKIFMVLLLIALTFAQSLPSFAAPVDTSAKATLTVTLSPDGVPIEGAEFKLYRIADISRTGTVTLTLPFSAFPVVFRTQSTEDLRLLALTLKGYVISRDIEPDYVGTTDSSGQATFENIPLGMYLVVGSSITVGNTVYIPEVFIVTLPAESENETWEYDVNVRTKAIINNRNIKTNVRVLKVWDDGGDKSARPEKIVAELYNGETLFDTVTLSKENNWHYTWSDLPGNDWIVVEKAVPDGYKVTVDREENSFIITNTKTDDEPENPDVTTTTPASYPISPDSDLPDSSDVTSTSTDTSNPDYTNPDSTLPSENVSGENPAEEPSGENGTTSSDSQVTDEDTGNQPSGSEDNPTLPQTGMLWWPVPVLAFAGIFVFMLGWRMNRRVEDES